MSPLPGASRPLAGFAQFLRQHRFAIAQEQVVTFLAAVGLLGPKDMESIRRAAHAAFAPPPERHGEFDAIFHAFFYEEARAVAIAESLREDDAPLKNGGVNDDQDAPPERSNESGEMATAREMLSARSFGGDGRLEPLEHLERMCRSSLPRRRSFRLLPGKKGCIDLRRSLRSVVRDDGDIVRLVRARRAHVQRQVLLLIDVSGSMKHYSEEYLRFAHALTQSARQVETFTFGTRLTRISRALARRAPSSALSETASLVADWNGGTRIGAALDAFLSQPRFASYARGAVVFILSDGLERGDHARMTEAVRRLAQRAFHLAWLTPLAEDSRFRPETAALKAILPYVDEVASSGSLASLVERTLAAGRAA